MVAPELQAVLWPPKPSRLVATSLLLVGAAVCASASDPILLSDGVVLEDRVVSHLKGSMLASQRDIQAPEDPFILSDDLALAGQTATRLKGTWLASQAIGRTGQVEIPVWDSFAFKKTTTTPAPAPLEPACVVNPGMNDNGLRQLRDVNCKRVKSAVLLFNTWQGDGWNKKAQEAQTLCEQAQNNTNMTQAANDALVAWGSILMDDRECCNLVIPPFCISSFESKFPRMVLLGFAAVVVILAWSAHRCFPTEVTSPSLFQPEEHETKVETPIIFEIGSAALPGHFFKDQESLRMDLHRIWMLSGLIHLPGARRNDLFGVDYADMMTEEGEFREQDANNLRIELSKPAEKQPDWVRNAFRNPDIENLLGFAAETFAKLTRLFHFQADNAKNQFEHFLSLWRSHCSVYADRWASEKFTDPPYPSLRGVEDEAQERDEDGGLLSLSLEELYNDQLSGFLQWRERMAKVDGPNGRPPTVRPQRRKEIARLQIRELAAFLLVWGEAGNLRFMPAMLYFLTDVLLSEANPDADRLPYTGGKSDRWLVQVIRPIYNVILVTHYKQSLEADMGHELRKDCAKFLPADAPNHDDWNELFNDPQRLKDTLVLKENGNKLFTDDNFGGRLTALTQVDWKESMKSSNTKTHREVHSIWGFFAGTHRLWFVHVLLFGLVVSIASVNMEPSQTSGAVLVGGRPPVVRVASMCLLVPLHTSCWLFARFFVKGKQGRRGCCANLSWWHLRLVPCFLPVLTYIALRYIEYVATNLCVLAEPRPSYCAGALGDPAKTLSYVAALHFAFAALGAIIVLFFAWEPEDFVFGRRTTGCCDSYLWDNLHQVGRYSFWIAVFAVKIATGLGGIKAVLTASNDLMIVQPTRQDPKELLTFLFSPTFDKSMMEWAALWTTSFVLFVADTGFWFAMGCTGVGALIALHHRGWKVLDLTFKDHVAAIPELFSKKVIFDKSEAKKNDKKFSGYFPDVWDQIVQIMRYEDKLSDDAMGQLSFTFNRDPAGAVDDGLRRRRPQEVEFQAVVDRTQYDQRDPERRGRDGQHEEVLWKETPQIFRTQRKCLDRTIMRDLPLCRDRNWPSCPEVQWRLNALARSLMYDMPNPFRVPYIPGLTVMIPHYGEDIFLKKKDLWKVEDTDEEKEKKKKNNEKKNDETSDQIEVVPLMSWLEYRYEEEFQAFTTRQSAAHVQEGQERFCPKGNMWDQYKSKEEWLKLIGWASLRSQTLFRTVAGMMYYRSALNFHKGIQAKPYKKSRLLWDVDEVFNCLVAMQRYSAFSVEELDHTERLLDKWKHGLRIAFIHNEAIDSQCRVFEANVDGIHPWQSKRYYSCVIDSQCDKKGNRRVPKYKIELPGWPILGDGKGDNQNHAIIFTRGSIIQAVDMNQGAYFEQMLLLPCALGEFRQADNKKGIGRRIIGFPEHIFSDIGSVGEFAAGAETAFGTVLQRAYNWMGARMHYGHPDMMNKTFMMQQGGVSKATKTVNLSEDIFAGMDLTLYGQGTKSEDREIKHCEYFHLAKGRDMGFQSVLTFFAKLSSGTGEQLLTRQVFRLGHTMGLPEFLTFYYAHGGFYFTQLLLSKGIPLLVFIWLLVVLDDKEVNLDFMDSSLNPKKGAEIVASMLVQQFSILVILFAIAQTMPLFLTVWLESGFFGALVRIAKQMATGAPLLFIFQAKVIGHYLMNEIRHGGATYAATGRGLPIERKPFVAIKTQDPNSKTPKLVWMGLYNEYALVALYDGARLLAAFFIVWFAGGLEVDTKLRADLVGWVLSLGITIASWLLAPFFFNPYQFRYQQWSKDLLAWRTFFDGLDGKYWIEWYEEVHLRLTVKNGVKEGPGLRTSPVEVLVNLMLLCAWGTILQGRIHLMGMVYSKAGMIGRYVVTLIPPFVSFLFSWAYIGVRRYKFSEEHSRRQAALSERAKQADPKLRDPKVRAPAVRLVLASAVVVAVDLAEVAGFLSPLLQVGWGKTVLAGVIMKYTGLSLTLYACECLFSRKTTLDKESYAKTIGFVEAAELWLHAHRMARDMAVSALIYVMLSPGYLFDLIRSQFTDLSLHNLIIYRDPTGIPETPPQPAEGGQGGEQRPADPAATPPGPVQPGPVGGGGLGMGHGDAAAPAAVPALAAAPAVREPGPPAAAPTAAVAAATAAATETELTAMPAAAATEPAVPAVPAAAATETELTAMPAAAATEPAVPAVPAAAAADPAVPTVPAAAATETEVPAVPAAAAIEAEVPAVPAASMGETEEVVFAGPGAGSAGQ